LRKTGVIFDEGLGNLFVIRLAGEVVDKFALGSVEYAAKYLNTPLILVLGHSECGAVHAAIEGKDYGVNINSIVAKITPAVEEARKMSGDIMVNSVIQNVLLVESELKNDPELVKLINNGGLQIFSGVYHLESGEVEFFTN
jgi:carbonic anhydrase